MVTAVQGIIWGVPLVELSERKLMILQAIIDDYITTAEPVGSRTLSRRYISDLSSATIRNEMSDLEEMGYLGQPHTSAGRVPSEKAYRYYVDRMMQVESLTPQEIMRIRDYYNERVSGMQDIVQQTVRAMSDMTPYASMALQPQLHQVTLQHVELVPIQPGLALLIVVTSAGIVKDIMLRVEPSTDPEQLHRISRMITDKGRGKSLADAIELIAQETESQTHRNTVLFNSVLDAMQQQISAQEDHVVTLGGAANLLSHPEYSDIGKARTFLTVLEDQHVLYDMLKRATDYRISISIGSENPYPNMKDMSVVTATYTVDGKPLGSIGVIGPTRMRYGNVVATLEHLCRNLGEVLSELAKRHDG